MKLHAWAWAVALTGCFLVSSASAQGLRQPFSVQPAGFDYNRYLNEGAVSPSDQPAPVVNAPSEGAAAPMNPTPAATPAPVATPSYSVAPASCTSCDTGCSTCAPSCGAPSCGIASCCGGGCCGLSSLIPDCCLGDAYSISSHLFCEGSAWSVGGWTQLGYHSESNGLFNSRPDELNLHQQWFYLEKAVDASDCCWDWGFRADLMYGIDGADTQAFGNTVDNNGNPRGWDTGWNHDDYGWALPQLYVELAKGDLSIKVGHFYTLIGYEVVTAPDNFFYSHAFTMYNSEPFTHTGAIATYSVNDCLDVYVGYTLGWDTGFDQFQDGSNFLGGFSATLTDDVTMTYMTTIGNFGARSANEEGYMHSIVVDTALTDNLQYVFQSDFLRVDFTGEDNVGINQYLFYTVNDCLALGTRLEWWKTDPLIAGAGSVSVYESTWGVNYRPHSNLVVRPEIRQEWSPAIDYDETIFGVDMVLTY